MATEEYNEAEMEIDQYLADWEYDSGQVVPRAWLTLERETRDADTGQE